MISNSLSQLFNSISDNHDVTIVEEKQYVFTNVVEQRIPVGSPADTERTWNSVKFLRPRGKTYLIVDTFEIYFIFCSKINRRCLILG